MRIIEWFLGLCFSLMFLGCLVVLYWMYYPYQMSDFLVSDDIKLQSEMHPGDWVHWQATIKTNRGQLVEVSKQLENSVGTIYETRSSLISLDKPNVGQRKYFSGMVIPDYVPFGMYHLVVYAQFHVNMIRTVTITRVSKDFLISPPNSCCREKVNPEQKEALQ